MSDDKRLCCQIKLRNRACNEYHELCLSQKRTASFNKKIKRFDVPVVLNCLSLSFKTLSFVRCICFSSRKNISMAGWSLPAALAVCNCWFLENVKKSYGVDSRIFLERVIRLAVDFKTAPTPLPAPFPWPVAVKAQEASKLKSFLWCYQVEHISIVFKLRATTITWIKI